MIDLHTHTSNSDGKYSTAQLINIAEENKLKYFSITDHNNINSYDQFEMYRKNYSGKIIPGVELEFVYDGILMDMLGYGIDLNILKHTDIIKKGFVHTTVEKETINLNYYKTVCDNLNIKYSNDLIINAANNMANDVILDNILLFEENKDKLDRLGIFDRTTFYRNHVLNKESPFFIDFTKGKFDIFYVTEAIHNAGGKCFLAHTFVYGLEDVKKFLDYIVSLKIIDGIECYHRKHTKEQIDFLIDYCNKNSLLKSGGSDYHNEKHNIGKADNGNILIDDNIILDWIQDINLI